MNRQNFLMKLKELFGDLSEGLVNAYKTVLTDAQGKEINYSELYRLLINEYKYRNAPPPSWFYEKLTQVKTCKNEPQSFIEKHLKDGSAKTLRHEPEKMRVLIQLPNGQSDWFYYGIAE